MIVEPCGEDKVAERAAENGLVLQKCTVGAKPYELVALVQAHNEEKLIPRFLKEVAKIVDGIVLLDDGSTDRTNELAAHSKIILKVRRPHNERFDDLGNRNLLLAFAELVPARWFLFLDVDEIMDERSRKELRQTVAESDADIVILRMVQLWGDEKHFRFDAPPPSRDGILYIPRLFKKKARMAITSSKRLHFGLIPYTTEKVVRSQILLKHYGNISRERRVMRYERYRREDPRGEYQPSYEHLLAEKVTLKPVEALYSAPDF